MLSSSSNTHRRKTYNVDRGRSSRSRNSSIHSQQRGGSASSSNSKNSSASDDDGLHDHEQQQQDFGPLSILRRGVDSADGKQEEEVGIDRMDATSNSQQQKGRSSKRQRAPEGHEDDDDDKYDDQAEEDDDNDDDDDESEELEIVKTNRTPQSKLEATSHDKVNGKRARTRSKGKGGGGTRGSRAKKKGTVSVLETIGNQQSRQLDQAQKPSNGAFHESYVEDNRQETGQENGSTDLDDSGDHHDEDDDDEEEEEKELFVNTSSDGDSDYQQSNSRSRTTRSLVVSRRGSQRAAAGTRNIRGSIKLKTKQQGETEDASDDDDGDEIVSPSPKISTRTRRRKNQSLMGDSDDDDDDDHSETNFNSSTSRRKKPTRSSARKAKNTLSRISQEEQEGSDRDIADSELEDLGLTAKDGSCNTNDDEEFEAPESKRRTRSAVVKKKIHKKTRASVRNQKNRKPTKKRSTAKSDSDEDFEIDSRDSDRSQSDEDESASIADDDEDFDVNDYEEDESPGSELDSENDAGSKKRGRGRGRVPNSSRKAVMNVDDEQIGTADDDSSSDDERHPTLTRRTAREEIHPSPRKGTFENSDLSSPDDDDNESSDKRKRKDNLTTSHRHSNVPFCPSTEDAITAENLPERHICYISPDGMSRQCFKIETLRHIALNSSQYNLRHDVDADRQNFLQPPHFRTAMSDDLVDQIASKFGRQALDLHNNSFWDSLRRKERAVKTNMNTDDDDSSHDSSQSSDSRFDEHEDIYDSFSDRLQRYFKTSMGNKDPYVCPLCYCQCYDKLDKTHDTDGDQNDSDYDDNGEDDDRTDKVYRIPEFRYDPMTVLGCADDDCFVVASQFCFLKLANVKNHLREVHTVDTSGLDGNSLYNRYRIRATDGLLQRWLKASGGHVSQGDMMKYWNSGCNQLFLQLLDLMTHARLYEQEVGDDDLSDDRKDHVAEFISQGQLWFDEGSRKAPGRWLALTAPFEKNSDNMKDFIAADDDVEEDEEEDEQNPSISHAELARKLAAADDDDDLNGFVAKIQRKYADDEEDIASDYQSEGDEDENEQEDGDGQEEDADYRITDRTLLHDGAYSEVESEDDDWVKSKITPRKRKSSVTAASVNDGAEDKGQRSGVKTPSSQPKSVGKRITKRQSISSSSSTPRQPVQPVVRRTPAIQESSDDED